MSRAGEKRYMDVTTEEDRILAFQKDFHDRIKVRAVDMGLADAETQPIYDGIADIQDILRLNLR